MATDDIKPAAPTSPYIGNEQGQREKRPGYGGSRDKQERPGQKKSIHDVTTFMGIPQEELTPAVSDAIISLMEDVDNLRAELSHTHSLEHMLSDNLDKHADLPVLTRHALGREIQIMCAHTARTKSISSFVYLKLSNSGEIKTRAGLLAFENIMREMAEMLKEQLRETDRIGTLGGDGFGILLALSDPRQALEKVHKLIDLLKLGPLMHDGQIIDVHVVFGIHRLHENETVESVLGGADKDLRNRHG